MRYLLILITFLISGCVDTPKGVKPIQNFQADLYLGTWYEIVRLDHSFERGMEKITATYSKREDGGIKVLNKGYITDKQEWSQAEGKAYFVEGKDVGFLKVSFFGPFYGSYIIMDTDYKTYTMISGPDHSYFWILSRTPRLDKNVLDRLLRKAKDAGFNTDKLIFIKQ
jgi:apolipoprotein D and lipocalin family protein